MKRMKRKLVPLCMLFLTALLVIPSKAYYWRFSGQDETQQKLKVLKGQLLQLEMRALEAQISQRQQEEPFTEKHVAALSEIEAQLRQMQKEFEALTGEAAVPSLPEEVLLNPKSTQGKITSLRVQIVEIEKTEVAARVIQLKRKDPVVAKYLPEMKDLQAEWQRLQNEYNQLTGQGGGGRKVEPNSGVTNDDCASATSIAVGDKITQDTTMASDGTTIPTCDTTAFNDVWFTFTGDGATHQVCTKGSDYDTVLQVYSGSCGTLTPVACNDDGGGSCGLQSRVQFTAMMGVTYFFQVTDFSGGGGTLCIGLDNGAPSVTPSPLDFGSQHITTTSAVMDTSASQTGCGRVTYTSITEGGTNPGDFDETLPTTPFHEGTCEATEMFPSTFTPSTEGPRSATLTYMTNVGPLVQTLMGTGTNTAPVANAGPDQTVREGTMVMLNGSATDADAHDAGGPFSFNWMQTATGGLPPVAGFPTSTEDPSFTAPTIPASATAEKRTLTFSLDAADLHGKPDATPDTVNIIVCDIIVGQDDNAPPAATPSRLRLDPCTNTFCWVRPDGTVVNGSVAFTFSATTVSFNGTAPGSLGLQGAINKAGRSMTARLFSTIRGGPPALSLTDNNIDNTPAPAACP